MLLQYLVRLRLILWPDLLHLVINILVNPLLNAIIVEGMLAWGDSNLFIWVEVVGADGAGLVVEFVLVGCHVQLCGRVVVGGAIGLSIKIFIGLILLGIAPLLHIVPILLIIFYRSVFLCLLE